MEAEKNIMTQVHLYVNINVGVARLDFLSTSCMGQVVR